MGRAHRHLSRAATESDLQYLLVPSQFPLDPHRPTVALSRAEDKMMILVAPKSVSSLLSAEAEMFANAQLWKSLPRTTCTRER